MKVMRKMNVTKSKKDIEAAIKTYDDDNTNNLNFEEFTTLMKSILRCVDSSATWHF